MAILNDLAKETSFRRFYLRWLAACWLPALGVVAIWAAAWLPGIAKTYAAMHVVTPLELWLLVGLGQWFFMRRYSRHAGRWAAASFFGGVIATFVWAVAINLKLRMSGIFYNLAIEAALWMRMPYNSVVAEVVGSAASGIAGALLPGVFLFKDWRDRQLWLILSGITSIAAYACMLPLQASLDELGRRTMFAYPSDTAMYVSKAMVSMMPTYLTIAWFFCSAVMGVFLWKLRERQALRESQMLPRFFD